MLWFFTTEIPFGLLKSAKLRKSATEKLDPKKHLSFSVATEAREQNSATESRRQPSSSTNVKVTAKRLDYSVKRTNRERLLGSNRRVKVRRGQL